MFLLVSLHTKSKRLWINVFSTQLAFSYISLSPQSAMTAPGKAELLLLQCMCVYFCVCVLLYVYTACECVKIDRMGVSCIWPQCWCISDNSI